MVLPSLVTATTQASRATGQKSQRAGLIFKFFGARLYEVRLYQLKWKSFNQT